MVAEVEENEEENDEEKEAEQETNMGDTKRTGQRRGGLLRAKVSVCLRVMMFLWMVDGCLRPV